jgi:hypothetical protein
MTMKTSPGEEAVGLDGDGCKQPRSSLPGPRMCWRNCVALTDVLVEGAMRLQNAAHPRSEGDFGFHVGR